MESPALYICGKNKGLHQLDKSPTFHIGDINVGAVLVADDLPIMARNVNDMQVALSIAEHDASRERYIATM